MPPDTLRSSIVFESWFTLSTTTVFRDFTPSGGHTNINILATTHFHPDQPFRWTGAGARSRPACE